MLLQLYEKYSNSLQYGDKRTKGWLLVDSPIPTLACVVIYLFTVWFGPKIMSTRKPFTLTKTMFFYNFFMAFLNFYVAAELFIGSYRMNYNYFCEPVRENYAYDEIRIVNAIWWHYFCKILEFSDSFFFILRKKEKQLSFLHIYHHSTILMFWWISVKWLPSGSAFILAMTNSIIHVLMYSYYGLAALGPKIAPFLWWKKYLTLVQIVQFFFIMYVMINGLRVKCEFPKWMMYLIAVYMLSFVVLFGKFYIRSYTKMGYKMFYGKTSVNITGCGPQITTNEEQTLKKEM